MLFVLVVLCCILTGLFLNCERKKQYVFATTLKGLASFCFVLIGFICSPGTHVAKLIVCGLVLGCIADVLLNLRLVYEEKGQLIFLVGILVFLTGHILYLAAVFPLSANQPMCIIIGIILTALLMVWILRQITAKPVFKVFGVIYLGAIMLLNCAAIGNLITAPSSFTGIFAAGTVLFLISDIVLILNTFGAEYRQSLRITNTSLYYAGQLLIALSLRLLT